MTAATIQQKTALERIAGERARHIAEEGYSHNHDDEHVGGELADAAACYADAAGAIVRGAGIDELHNVEDDVSLYDGNGSGPTWPWHEESFKLSQDPVRDLVKAGALIIAEIERIERMDPQAKWWLRS